MRQSILFVLLSILNVQVVCSYTDPEIEHLLTSLSDPYDPSFDDYLLIEHYFLHGNRPYLETMRKNTHIPDDDFNFRIQQLRNFKLIGENGEMPICEIRAINLTEETKDRCILIYGSFNPYYPQRANRLFDELNECGYSGNVMLRIGGIPNISQGGAKLCTIPYTWRIHFFKEAHRLGFTKIFYLDASLHPLSDLSAVFDVIDNYGLFACSTGDWACDDFIEYIEWVGIPIELRSQIPWFHSYAIGLNFTNEKICELFEKWDQAIHRMDGFCSMGDDVIFTSLAWHLGFHPYYSFDEIITVHDFPPQIWPSHHQFYQDTHRTAIRLGWGSVYD